MSGCGTSRKVGYPVQLLRLVVCLCLLCLPSVQAQSFTEHSACIYGQVFALNCPGRIGEASNPGPPESCNIEVSTCNPSGLRGKEAIALERGPGIHCFSETQLSAHTVQRSCQQLRLLGQAQSRLVRTIPGQPAPARATSSWAGAWSGVLTVSDLPCRPVMLPWQAGLFNTGRVQVTQHFLQDHCITVGNLYGFAKGPTFPDSLERTNLLLQDFTREVVFGLRGIRIICGDYNHSPSELSEVSVWLEQGWIEIQDLAAAKWQTPKIPTCKHATYRDFIFLSPEAAAFCVSAQVSYLFQEHATVSASFSLPCSACVDQSWPLPGEVPWSQVEVEDWHLHGQHAPVDLCGPTDFYRKFSRAWESSLAGFVRETPHKSLPSHCYGRARRTQPCLVRTPTGAKG